MTKNTYFLLNYTFFLLVVMIHFLSHEFELKVKIDEFIHFFIIVKYK